MKILGLTGGIASGKSAVAAELAALGAIVLDADQAAHEVINQPSVQKLLVERWGDEIVTPNLETDRAVVAGKVFSADESSREELEFLEGILHPRIRRQFQAKLEELSAQGAKVAVIDAPLLLEAGWQDLCDGLIFVDSPRTDRLARAIQRNWTEADFAKREACQMPIAEKREQSTHVLSNLGTLADLRDRVQDLWASLEV